MKLRLLHIIISLLVPLAALCQSEFLDKIETASGKFKAKDYEGAIAAYSECLDLCGKESPEWKKLNSMIGDLYYLQAYEIYSKESFLRVYELYNEAFTHYTNAMNPSGAFSCLENMAFINLSMLNDPESAYKQYEAALTVAGFIDDPRYKAKAISGMIAARTAQGRLEEVASLRVHLNDIYSKMDSSDKLSMFDSYHDRAIEAIADGRYVEAENYLKKAELLSDDDPDQRTLVDMGFTKLYSAMGDYRKALSYSEKVVQARLKDPLCNDASRYLEYTNHCHIQMKLGDETGCMASLDSLEISVRAIDTPSQWAKYHNLRANVYLAFNHNDKACEEFETAERLFDEAMDPADMYHLLNCYALHARTLFNLGKFKDASERYMWYFGSVCQLFGEDSPEYIDACYTLSQYLAFTGNIESAWKAYSEYAERNLAMVAKDTINIAPHKRKTYWKERSEHVWDMASFGIAAGLNDDDFTTVSYEALVFGKNFLLAAEKNMSEAVYASGDPELIALYEELDRMDKVIDSARNVDDVEALSKAYNSRSDASSRFVARARSLGIEQPVVVNRVEEILANLKPDEAVVDYVDFLNTKGNAMYVAYVLRGDARKPHVVRLAYEQELKDILANNRNNWSRLYDERNAPLVLDLLWNPLEESLKGINRVYLVPSGMVNVIALESMPLPDGSLLGDSANYDIVRLSSAREIVKNRHRGEWSRKPSSAVLYGGLDYNVPGDVMAREAATYEVPRFLALRDMDFERGDSVLYNLPFTAEEVDSIHSILSRSGLSVKKRMDVHGSEESFFSMNGDSPDILQLSTHGFFYTKDKVPEWSGLSGNEDPMMLSGLALSGANAEWLKQDVPEGVHGGLLRSAEIQLMDLSGTQMAVLSACRTAQGFIDNEGVYGLQRAFKRAGVQTLVLSLWSVNDGHARDFMTDFYRNLVSNGWNRRKAFRDARAKMRATTSDPRCWAAFIMID